MALLLRVCPGNRVMAIPVGQIITTVACITAYDVLQCDDSQSLGNRVVAFAPQKMTGNRREIAKSASPALTLRI